MGTLSLLNSARAALAGTALLLPLADVSQGKQVTIDNFFELFNGILNPRQIEGLRLTPFPQQQFNQADNRRSVRPHRGVARRLS